MPSDITVFAETNFRNQRRKFGIKVDDRRRHMYVVGKTGMGKSTLLENMVVTDIRAGHGLAVVDPHGDLAEKILSFIPNERVNDVIYFNPSDTQFPIAFNILETIGPEYKHLVAYGLVGVFKKIWADSWGPRMEYIMTNTILALLDYPGSTLLGVMRMLVDKTYRKKVVSKVTDPVIKTFWADEFANYSEKFRTEAIAPIQNKIGQFLASSIIRNIVGQSKSTIEMREIMDGRKILIMNLAKGRIGEENSALLGAMMITKLQIAAMSRVDISENERKDFFLYVDEFQNFATDSFAGILSEARKYRLCLIMAHQYFEQLNDVVKAAVFGNVGTLIVFRVGATDAAELELEFAPQFMPTDIVNLKKYTFCMRLMVDGVATEPFSAIGLPPVTGTTDNTDKVVRVSRERYARPQNLVEDRIIRWSGVEVARPQGQTTPTLNADEFSDDDFGDDDVPETAAPQPSDDATESDNGTTEKAQEATPPDRLQAEAEARLDQSMDVDLSKLIPGEQANVPPTAAPAKVALASVTTELDLTPPAIQPPAEQFFNEAPPSTRPKINFAPDALPPTSAVTSVQATPPPVPILPAKSVAPITPVAVPVTPRPVAPPPERMPVKSVVQPQLNTPTPAPSKVTTAPPKVTAPAPVSAPAKTNAPAPASGGLSLKALQTGTAPQVSFKELNRVQSQNSLPVSVASNPTSKPTPVPAPRSTLPATPPTIPKPKPMPVAPQQPQPPVLQRPAAPVTSAVKLEPMPATVAPIAGSHSTDLVPGNGNKKRRRKRKRKPGQVGGGEFNQSSQGQNQSETQNQPRPQAPQPNMSAPRPTPSPVVRPLPPQPKPLQPPSKPADTTKVSLKDLI